MPEKIYIEIRGGAIQSIKTTTSNIDIVVTDWDDEETYPRTPDVVLEPEALSKVIAEHIAELYK